MISIKNISKQFGDVQAVQNVSFDILPGEVVGFLGPNGAGKSTTMRLITGYLKPNAGQILIDGIDVVKDPITAQKKIGYLPESTALYLEMVVLDFLLFVGRIRHIEPVLLKERLKAVIKQCQLNSVLGRKIGELSKGFKQRVGLAQALLHDPEILILDEPTVGLDPNQIIEIRDLIKEIGKTKTILLSTHILQEVSATCQRVIIINNGCIVAQGTPENLIKQSVQKTVYRVGVRGDLIQMIEEIKQLPDYVNHDVAHTEDNLYFLQIQCSGQDDLCEKIFDLAVANHWRLSHLEKEKQSLENVFQNLTM